MASPKKEKALKRTHPVMLRFKDAEEERLIFYAEAERLPLAESIRKHVPGKPAQVRYDIVTERPDLKHLIHYVG